MHIHTILLLLICSRVGDIGVLIEVVFRTVLFVSGDRIHSIIALSWVTFSVDGLSEVSFLGSFREILMVVRVMYGRLVLMIGVFPVRLLNPIRVLIHGRDDGCCEIESALWGDWLVVVHEIFQSLGDVI